MFPIVSQNYRVRLRYLRRYTKMLHMAFWCSFQHGKMGLAHDPGAIVGILNQPLRKLNADGQESREAPPRILTRN